MGRFAKLTLGLVFLVGCSTELPHESPYDPQSDLEKQARASVTGKVRLERETDHSQVTIELANELRTYSIDTDAQGSAALAGVVPGSYRLSIRTRYFQPVTQQISIGLAERFDFGTVNLAANRAAVSGLALRERQTDIESLRLGGVNLSLTRVASLRSALAAAPSREIGEFRKASTTATVTMSTVSAADGSYQFSDVPAGVYELTASDDSAGAVTVSEVVVTGEESVVVDEILVRPLTGFFTVQGKVNGAPNGQFTQVPSVDLVLAGFNAHEMKIAASTDGTVKGCDLDATPREPYSSSRTGLSLLGGEGENLICVVYYDEMGNSTDPLTGTILYDATPPSPVLVQALTNNGYVQTNQVLVTIAAADTHSGVAALKLVSSLADLDTALPETFRPTISIPLVNEGLNTHYLEVLDAAGNASGPFLVAVTRDTQPPVPVSLSIEGGDDYARSHTVNLTIDATGATQMQLSESNAFTGASWEPYATNRSFTFSPGEGQKTVHVRFRDEAGWVSGLISDTIEIDTTPPILQNPPVTLGDGAAYVNSNTVQVTVRYVNEDAVKVVVAEDAALSFPIGEENLPGGGIHTFPVTLSGGEGIKTVYVKFFDAAGNSIVQSASIGLDKTPPVSGLVRINENQPYVSRLDGKVMLSLSAHDSLSGIAQVRVSNSNLDGNLDGAPATPFTPQLAWTLDTPGAEQEGVRTVWASFLDAAGNEMAAPVSDTVIYDTQAPVAIAPEIVINGGEPFATSTFATVALQATGAQQMMLSENPLFSGARWEEFATETIWVLSSSNEKKTLYVKFRDAAGNEAGPFSASVTLDTVPPSSPSITIENGAPFATQTNVSLTLAASGATHMQVSNDGVFHLEPIEPIAPTIANWVLPAGDGVKAVYARFFDEAGNVSVVVSDFIILDTTPPVVHANSLRINDGAEFTNDGGGAVTLTLSVNDAHQMYLSEGTCGSGGSWQGYADKIAFALQPTQGLHTVYAKFRDEAGNETACVSDSITLDSVLEAPGLAVALDGKENIVGRTADAFVTINVSNLSSDVSEILIGNDSAFAMSTWIPADQSHAWFLPAGDGPKTVFVKFRDKAGNESAVFQPQIVLDQTGPEAPVVAVADATGDGFALSSDSIELAWNAPSDPNLAGFELQRYVRGLDTTFLLVGDLAAGVVSFVDDVKETTGYPHEYRIRAYDDLGNRSGWSIPIVALPYEPVTTATWVSTVETFQMSFPPKRGTFSMVTEYRYENAEGERFATRLLDNLTSYERSANTDVRWNEALEIRTGNQDNSLVQDVRFLFQSNFREIASPETNSYVSIDIDSRGNPVVMSTGISAEPQLIRREGNGWVHSVLPRVNSNSRFHFDHALDANNHAHVVWMEWGSFDLYYATDQSGTWEWAVVDTKGRTGDRASIAIDGFGDAHVVAYDTLDWEIRYSRKVGGGWQTETVAAGGSLGGDLDIAADAAGNVYSAFVTQSTLWVGTRTDSWSLEAVSSATRGGGIASDADGRLHVAYVAADNRLVYGVRTGATWAFQVVDDARAIGKVKMSVDAKGYPMIAYADSANNDVYLATNKRGYWEQLLVDGTGHVGGYLDVRAGLDGVVHMAYSDTNYNGVKYAHVLFESPAYQNFGKGENIATVLDSAGTLHAFYSQTCCVGPVYYLENSSGAFTKTEVAPIGGKRTSISIDGAGGVHGVWGGSDNQLRYAKNVTGTFSQPDIIFSNSSLSSLFSLDSAVDQNDQVHVTFVGSDNIVYYMAQANGWQPNTIVSNATQSFLEFSHGVTAYILVRVGGGLRLHSSVDSFASYENLGNFGFIYDFVIAGDGTMYILTTSSQEGFGVVRNDGSGWHFTAIPTKGIPNSTATLAVGKDGALRISYYDNQGEDLRYVIQAGGHWHDFLIASEKTTGYGNSVRVSADDRVAHFMFYDWNNRDLQYHRVIQGVEPAVEVRRGTTFGW